MKGMFSVAKPVGPAKLKARPSGLVRGGKRSIVGGSPLKTSKVK